MPVAVEKKASILDPGFDLTLRPMRYPVFYEMYKAALKNTWNVDEVDFSPDINDLRKMTPAERPIDVPKSKVAARKPSPVSLMPEGLVDDLSQGQLADLLAFLLSPPPQ